VASRPQFWLRPQPRPRGFGLGLASVSLSYYVIGVSSCKNRVKFGILLIFPAIILNHNVVNHYLVLFWIWRKLLTECRERCYTGV